MTMIQAASEPARILLVDDEPAVREVLRQALQAEGFEVELAAHGGEAVARMKTKPYDLVLTDLVMPEMDGIQTILELKAIDPTVPVIAMSGASARGEGDFLPLARQLGARAVLGKPFEYQTFMQSVREALGGAA